MLFSALKWEFLWNRYCLLIRHNSKLPTFTRKKLVIHTNKRLHLQATGFAGKESESLERGKNKSCSLACKRRNRKTKTFLSATFHLSFMLSLYWSFLSPCSRREILSPSPDYIVNIERVVIYCGNITMGSWA